MKTKNIYHETQSEALELLTEELYAKGYRVTSFSMVDHVAYETTNSYTFVLEPTEGNRKPRTGRLAFVQLYRMPTGRYELNFYTNI